MGRFVEAEELVELSSKHFERGNILSLYCSVLEERFPEGVLARLETLPKKYPELQDQEDLERNIREVSRYLAHHTPARGKKGLALFASAANDFLEVYELPQPWKYTAAFGPLPYTRPLSVIFDEYCRVFLVLADRREARFFEIYLGEVREHEPFYSEVPSKVRAGGWYGLEERRIARSIEQKIFHHFQDVADILLDHFRRKHFEVFFVGLREEEYAVFERVLPSYLRERLRGRVTLDPRSGWSEILKVALDLERLVLKENDDALLDRLLTMIGNADLATMGLANVLRAASFGACQTVVVDEGYRESGFLCQSCGTMALSPGNCELCGEGKEEVGNIVEEVLEVVVLQRGEVKYITSDHPRAADIQHIGAFLRFQV